MGVCPSVIEIDGLCDMLSIGKNTAYNLLINGEIDCFKMGSVWKIPISAVEQYIQDKCKANQKQIKKNNKLYKLIKKNKDLEFEKTFKIK